MAKLGQLADVHDSLVELLRTMDSQVLLEWIGAATGLAFQDIRSIRERSPTIAALGFLHPARKRIADMVLLLLGPDDRAAHGLILELQLSFDWSKRWTWPLLATALSAEIRRLARVIVFSPDPQLRAAIRRRLLPKLDPRAILVEPEHIPLICDADQARRQPRETIFAALYHVAETDEPIELRVAGIRAAMLALRTLDQPEQLRYGALMESFTPDQIIRQAVDEMRESGDLDEPDLDHDGVYPGSYADVHGRGKGLKLIVSPSVARVLEQLEEEARDQGLEQGLEQGWELGHEQGREEGREQEREAQRATLRQIVLDVLDARGIAPSPMVRARIEACTDIGLLTRMCTKASTITGSPDQLFGEPG